MALSVYFISGCKAGTTFEYRVLQKQEQLALRNIRSTVRQNLTDRKLLIHELTTHDILYLYRIAHSPLIEELINQARIRNIPVIFDIDDLVFEPEIVYHIDPVKAMSHEEAILYYNGVWRYRRTLLNSDVIITSTDYLAERARLLKQEVFVHHNGLSQWMIKEARRLVKQTKPPSQANKVIIGYGSGTATHRKDLEEIAGALAQIMAHYPNVELHLVGELHIDNPLPLPKNLKAVSGHIHFHPNVSWKEWLNILSKFDINLAPLEANNPYSKAKSEIKYTEAAAVGVPTVASRTGAFEFAINDGKNGFLASTQEEWITKLQRLVTDPSLRHKIGKRAYADILSRYTPEILGEQLVKTLNAIRSNRKEVNRTNLDFDPEKAPLILNWVFPEPIPGSGGHRDIIRMINLLASFGHQINAYVVPRWRLWDKSDLEIREFVKRHFGDLNGTIYKWTNNAELVNSDAVILTHWSTAYLMGNIRDTFKIFYFVQDWEPFFFPMGTEYLRAEQTYKMEFSCITLGQWLTKRLRDWYDADADYFDLAVDHSVYYPHAVEKVDHPRICFYARPSTPRRLFPMGIEVLNLIYEQRPDVEIILYGTEDTKLSRHKIPFPYTNRGILSEEQLAELFSTCEVGIVFSSTNCSLVPPEMMACKCAVVDLDRETVMGVLEHEVNALLAEPIPDGIASAVLRLLEDKSLRERLVENAYQQMQERSWSKSARKVEDILYQKISAKRQVLTTHRSSKAQNLPDLNNLPRDQQKHLNAVHTKRKRFSRRLKAIAESWRRRLQKASQGMLLNGAPVHTLSELTSRKRFGQHFVAQQYGLCGVDVVFETFNRHNTRDIIFHLKKHPLAKHDLATIRLNASLITNQGYTSFVFAPQPNSRGKSYYFSIESPNSLPGDAVTLWAYRNADVPGAKLERNGHIIDGHLIFGLCYQDEKPGMTREHPLIHNWGRQTTLWSRLKKARDLLKHKGLGELLHEFMNYWKWITRRIHG
jgi:glycosyltransferase involved in cell wall biosynthesis